MSIAFRVDFSSEIGSGHLMRCIRLSKSLKKNNKNIFFIIKQSDYISEIKSLLSKENLKLILLDNKNKKFSYKSDAESTIKILKKKKIQKLIVDNYKIDSKWEKKVKKYIKKLIVIDDLANRNHYCDIIIDQNYVKNYKTRYDKIINKDCIKLLGPKFCINNQIKKKFNFNHKSKKLRVRRIFVFFSAVFIPRVYEMIVTLFSAKPFKHINIDFVIGNLEKKNFLKLKKSVNKNINLMITNKNIENLMSRADLAIGSGGTNTWERISIGLPSIVFCIANNQKKICEFLSKKKIINYLGLFNTGSRLKLKKEIIKTQNNYKNIRINSEENKHLIDGFGLERINFFINKPLKEKIKLKKISFEDIDLMFNWVNDALVRKNSFMKKKIKYSDHKKWFEKKIFSNKSLILKLLLNNIPIGQIRYDKKSNFYEIDYSIDEAFRNYGFGRIIIKKSIKKFFKKKTIIRADVKQVNKQSIKIFKSLKFQEIESSSIKKRFEILSSNI